MSLVTDAEYLIYRMRLSLLSIPDPLIERIITLPTESDNDYILAEQPNANSASHNNEITMMDRNADLAKNLRIRTGNAIVRKTTIPRRMRHVSGESTITGHQAYLMPHNYQRRIVSDSAVYKRTSNMTTRSTVAIKSPDPGQTPDVAKTPETISSRPESSVGNEVAGNGPPRTVEAALDQAEARRQTQLQALKDQLQVEERKLETLAMEIAATLAQQQQQQSSSSDNIEKELPTHNGMAHQGSGDITSPGADDGESKHRRTESEASSVMQPIPATEKSPGVQEESSAQPEEDDDDEVFLKPPADAQEDISDQSETEDQTIPDKAQGTQALGVATSAPREMAYSISKESDVSEDEFVHMDDDVGPEVLNIRIDSSDMIDETNEPEMVVKVEGGDSRDAMNGDGSSSRDAGDDESRESIPTENNTRNAGALNGEPPAITADSRKPSNASRLSFVNPNVNGPTSPNAVVSRQPSKTSSQHSSTASKLFQTNVFAKRELPRSESSRGLVKNVRGSASQLLDSLRSLGRPVSALTTLINERANTNNPFAEDYSSFVSLVFTMFS